MINSISSNTIRCWPPFIGRPLAGELPAQWARTAHWLSRARPSPRAHLFTRSLHVQPPSMCRPSAGAPQLGRGGGTFAPLCVKSRHRNRPPLCARDCCKLAQLAAHLRACQMGDIMRLVCPFGPSPLALARPPTSWRTQSAGNLLASPNWTQLGPPPSP